MFEHYTERARRTIFFARYEASQFGTPYIEAAFLLLALFREDRALIHRFLPSGTSIEQVRTEVERNTVQGPKISTSVDLPLSDECKRVLAYASEESARLHHQHIGNEHLLLGLLREEQSLSARLLTQHGVSPAKIRESLQTQPPAPPRNVGIGSGGTRRPFSFPVTTIKVSDVPKSTAFYGALGFSLMQQIHSGQIALLNSGPCQIALVHDSLADNLFCFLVGDLAATAFHLQTAGQTLEQQLTSSTSGMDTMLVRDPDDHVILLVSITSAA